MIKFLCKIGIHLSTFWDSTMFGGVDRCNYCGEATDKAQDLHIKEMSRIWRESRADNSV